MEQQSNSDRNTTILDWIVRAGSLVLVALGIWIGMTWLYTRFEDSSPSANESRVLTPRKARARAVCERTRVRVQRGATPSAGDVEGWLVELLLLREGTQLPLTQDPALEKFFSKPSSNGERRFISQAIAEIASISGPGSVVTIQDASLPDATGRVEGLSGIQIAFSGRYVTPYFQETSRFSYYRIATLLMDQLQIDYGALYARCEHETTHVLGSWFQGMGAHGAATALLVGMDLFANVPQVAFQTGSDATYSWSTLQGIETAAQHLSREKLNQAVGEDGGMVSGRGDARLIITFPYNDGNRAARASRKLAKALDILADETR